MNFFGFFLVIFGFIIIYNPDIIATLIGIFIIIIGANMIFLKFMFKKNEKESFKIGEFEIFRNKKNR